MATDHPIRVAGDTVDASVTAGGVTQTLMEALVKRTALVLGPTESLGDVTQASGEVALAVLHGANGQVYFYNASDTTSPDDGVTVLVDGSGHRYQLQDNATLNLSSVAYASNTPEASPAVGDIYRCGTAPTGAWAAHANDLAAYTKRGWVFVTPNVGMTVLNEQTGQNEQFDAGGAWGAFNASHSDASIQLRALEWPMGLAVESVLNTPPGSPTEGLAYIVGGSPTGAFVGHSTDIAIYVDGAWTFMDAYDGARVYDRDAAYMRYFDAGAWGGQAVSNVQTFTSSGTWVKPAIGTMAFVQVWGGGGSGGREAEGGGGGGGGGYNEKWLLLSDLLSSEGVTIGAGGAAKTTDGTGNVGGTTAFGGQLYAFGGAGGGVNTTTGNSGPGGGGAGTHGAGHSPNGTDAAGGTGGNTVYSPTAQGISNGTPGVDAEFAGGNGGNGTNSGIGGAGGDSVWGGAGGGGAGATNGAVGGNSMKGGAGGGGSCDSGTAGAGGVSRDGGNGGAAGTDSANGTAGSQPGGGGGAAELGNSGKGGDGMCRVTVI